MAQQSRRYIIAVIFTIFFLIGTSFAAGWVANWALNELDVSLPLPDIPLPNGQSLQPTTPAAVVEVEKQDLAVFWEAMELLDKNFYAQDELPRSHDVTYAAIEGIIEQTGDPHSSFLNPDQASEFEADLDGEFEGIGARVDMGDEGLVIVAPFPGTPAAEAGLQPGDVVVQIDGESTQGMDIMQAVSRVRGERGTVVSLTIKRAGEAQLLEIDVTRGHIVIPVVETELIEEEGLPPIGYLRLTDFGRNSVDQFKKSLRELAAQGAQRLILDLRFNPGGLLDASVQISSQFIDDGLILSEKTSTGQEINHPAQSGGLALDIPLVVLINEGSASASEIVAGAIQDTKRGTLIGTTTFGKGSVQRLHNLSDNSLLRITVARWFTPNGNGIHETGIDPDIYVEWNREETAPDEDPQLDAALEFFKNQ
ncbi:MAG: S41 family peptidase [Ardenticatenaceae bacterium]